MLDIALHSSKIKNEIINKRNDNYSKWKIKAYENNRWQRDIYIEIFSIYFYIINNGIISIIFIVIVRR